MDNRGIDWDPSVLSRHLRIGGLLLQLSRLLGVQPAEVHLGAPFFLGLGGKLLPKVRLLRFLLCRVFAPGSALHALRAFVWR
jgi:hypothetical protein